MERYLVKRGLNRIIILPIVLSVLYAAVLIWQIDRMLSADDWVQHTERVLALASDAQRHIQIQESSLRGYLLTPLPFFVTRFHNAEGVTDTLFQELHVLIIDNPAQTLRLDTIMQTYWTWQASARQSLASALGTSRETMSRAAQDSSLLYRAGLALAVQTEFQRLNAEENRLYDQRSTRFRNGTTYLLLIITGASLILGIIVGLNARRQTKQFVDRFSQAIDETTRNRDLLETTLLSITDAIIVTDTEERITLMNGRAEELTGWTQSEAQGRFLPDVLRVLDEEDRTLRGSPVREVLRERHAITAPGRLRLLSRLGVDYPIEQTAAPVHDSLHRMVSVVIVFRDITDLRENERQAEQREREFRALIENAPDVIIRYARDLRIVYANPAVEQLLGIGPQALIGRRFKDVGIPEPVYLAWEQSVSQVFETGRGASTELQYRTVRGVRSYHTRLVPEGTDGESVISIARDITELKQTEQRLRESERRFRSIVENSPDAFSMLRAVRETQNGESKIVDFVFEHMNRRSADLLTLPVTEVVGRRLSEALPGERPRQFIEKYARVVESGTPAQEDYNVETPYIKKARWLHSQYVPIGDLLAVITTDITSRMQTVRALQRSEERYRRLVEHASEAIFSTDREGRFTYANPYIRELGGYANEDITKFVFTDLVSDEHRERVKRHFFRQFISRTPYSHIEAPFTTKTRKEIWLAITTSLDIHGDELAGFDCVATDITERRQMEQELKDVRSHEASRIQEESERLRAALRQPIERMRAASQSLSEQTASTGSASMIEHIAREISLEVERVLTALNGKK